MSDNNNFRWLAYGIGGWLGLCITMNLIYSPDEQYNDIIRHCGDSSAFCACQPAAPAGRSQDLPERRLHVRAVQVITIS
jgi:hypothetical protein